LPALVIFFLFTSFKTFSQQAQTKERSVNIFVFDNPHQKKIIDQTVWWRARWHAYWSKGKMIAFRAKSPEQGAERIENIVHTRHVAIGHLWFDSHGYYSNRQSTFYFGGSRINYRTINNMENLTPLQRIAALCNSNTHITLGACFTAATYNFPDKDSLKGRKMDGDSLLLALAAVFKQCTIYGCQSWVMENPGIWHGGYRLAGAPILRMYKDELFKPAWQNIGKWTKYNPATMQLEECHTIAMNNKGDVFEKEKNFQSLKGVTKKINRSLRKLRPGLYNNQLKVEL
jgi:hypothetical protein